MEAICDMDMLIFFTNHLEQNILTFIWVDDMRRTWDTECLLEGIISRGNMITFMLISKLLYFETLIKSWLATALRLVFTETLSLHNRSTIEKVMDTQSWTFWIEISLSSWVCPTKVSSPDSKCLKLSQCFHPWTRTLARTWMRHLQGELWCEEAAPLSPEQLARQLLELTDAVIGLAIRATHCATGEVREAAASTGLRHHLQSVAVQLATHTRPYNITGSQFFSLYNHSHLGPVVDILPCLPVPQERLFLYPLMKHKPMSNVEQTSNSDVNNLI